MNILLLLYLFRLFIIYFIVGIDRINKLIIYITSLIQVSGDCFIAVEAKISLSRQSRMWLSSGLASTSESWIIQKTLMQVSDIGATKRIKRGSLILFLINFLGISQKFRNLFHVFLPWNDDLVVNIFFITIQFCVIYYQKLLYPINVYINK